ncbi:EF-hand domain-containing protein [Aeoliella sp. ICT_H6.2]|uniref:EF-hand domain-containing protein n=1 Tax=Aeoliella straminimaris TaxID=2954799 RepID=A0A9X2FFB6_9BACT|nr:EF-hand domain-containing protein [Aeoliella straminimaris]MCO6048050.1 EF-hand domain-containing protein [Aeoliella straminimaris]
MSLLVAAGIAAVVCAGCGKGYRSAQASNPADAAAAAIDQYDSNNDGALDANELEASLALADALSRIDSNSDGKLAVDEIEARLRQYASLSEFIAGEVSVTRNGQPVEAAEVTFTPEPFMGDGLPVYQGTTGNAGTTSMLTDPPTPGVAVGFYRVTIKTSDGEEIQRGVEIADDSPTSTRIGLEI